MLNKDRVVARLNLLQQSPPMLKPINPHGPMVVVSLMSECKLSTRPDSWLSALANGPMLPRIHAGCLPTMQ